MGVGGGRNTSALPCSSRPAPCVPAGPRGRCPQSQRGGGFLMKKHKSEDGCAVTQEGKKEGVSPSQATESPRQLIMAIV